MKISMNDVSKCLKKYKDQPDTAKQLIRYWFSFPENIDVYSKFCFPEHIQGDVPEFHKEFYDILLKPGSDALASPRGSAKSTTVGLVFISWSVVNKKEKYIVYISQNHSKTTQFIEPLRVEFANNQRLKWLYGDLTAKATKDDTGRDREDCIDINKCRIEAVSFEKNMRGFKYGNMRPTLIIGDDIESDDRVINPVLREKDSAKLNKVIIPSLDINGRFKMIGTILHLDSLLMKKIKQWNGIINKSINDDGTLLWPQRFTVDKLQEIRDNIGSVAFQQEYLNNPVDNETSTIKREWIIKSFDSQMPYSYEDMDQLYLGVDFAFSDRITADSSAFMDVGIKTDRFGNMRKYILNMVWKKGMSVVEQFDYIRQLHYQHDYSTIALEENSIKSVSAEVKSMAMPIKMFWTGSRDTHNRTAQGTSKSYSKENAIERLAVEFENEMWCIPYRTEVERNNADRLLGELTSWAKQDGKIVEVGQHPDMPISMLLINESLNKPKYGITV